MKVKIKALDTFYHGRLHAERGGEYEMGKGEADELVKAGLAEHVEGSESQADGVDTLLGGDKMEDEHENKMAKAPANKGKK